MDTKEPLFSETLKVLLFHSKRDQGPFTIESLRKILAPIYHEDMRLQDILTVVHGVLMEALKFPEFEIPNASSIHLHILLSPITGLVPLKSEDSDFLFGPKLSDKFTLEAVYNRLLTEYMYSFMFTNVGWCRDYVFPEEKDKVE